MRQKLQADLKTALKKADKPALATIRLLLADIKNSEIKKGGELDEAEIVKILKRQVKQRREAEEQFRRGGREDLADKEAWEAEFIQGYLPPELSDKEIDDIIAAVLTELGEVSMKDFGKVMSLVMGRINGAANGKRVNVKVRRALAEETS